MKVSKAILGLILAMTSLAFVAQFAIDLSPDNIGCACIILTSVIAMLLYLHWTDALDTHPLSTFTIFGFCVTTQLGALLAQSAAWTAVTASLRQPVATFGILAMYQGIAMVMHATYRVLTPSTRNGTELRRLLEQVGLYTIPSAGTLWFMGCVGFVAFLGHGIFFGRSNEGIASKISDAFDFLTWAPFVIPLYLRIHGDSYCNAHRARVLLLIFALVIAAFGLAANVRTIMFSGVATVGLCYLLAGMRSNREIQPGGALKLAVMVVVALALAGPISDLATAMQIARASRGKGSAVAMIENTLDVWKQPYLIQAYRDRGKTAALYHAYDENYIANPILARLVTTKYHDNALYFAGSLTTEDSKEKLRAMTIKFMWLVLPSPLLAYVGPHLIIKTDMNFSVGDYLAYLSRGVRLGSYLVGSEIAHGIALFGIAFPLVYAFICCVLFWQIDLLSYRPASGTSVISAVALMNIWHFFIGWICTDSLSGTFSLIVRSLPQMLAVYLFVFALARMAQLPRVSGRHEPPIPSR